jgi:hypothetical protein
MQGEGEGRKRKPERLKEMGKNRKKEERRSVPRSESHEAGKERIREEIQTRATAKGHQFPPGRCFVGREKERGGRHK